MESTPKKEKHTPAVPFNNEKTASVTASHAPKPNA